MKYGHQIETERLIIRSWNLTETDRKAFHLLNSDEQVMHFFPFSRSREEADKKIEEMLETARVDGYGWSAICLKEQEAPIGFAGLSKVNFDAPFTPTTEIGWRILPDHWRKGYAKEAASALIQHGFEDLKLDEIHAFAVKDNIPSISVMKSIGMQHIPEMDFEMPGIDDGQKHLKLHVLTEYPETELLKKSKTKKPPCGTGGFLFLVSCLT